MKLSFAANRTSADAPLATCWERFRRVQDQRHLGVIRFLELGYDPLECKGQVDCRKDRELGLRLGIRTAGRSNDQHDGHDD